MVDRKEFIGSSEIAAVMGLSRWATPLSLWAKKTGEIPEEDISGREYVEWGNRLEEVVAQKFADENNVKLMAYKKRYVHKRYDFIRCELDRLIVGTDELVEVKTCSAWKSKEWEDEEIPVEYILQVMLALGLSGRKVGHIAVLIGGNTYKQKKIEFDHELYERMISQAVAFWEGVKKKEPPMAMVGDKETLGNLYDAQDIEVELPDSLVSKIEDSLALKRTIKAAYEEIEAIENSIKEQMKEGSLANVGAYKITWKEQISKRVDPEKLKEDGIYENYLKETKSRVLRISKPKPKKVKNA